MRFIARSVEKLPDFSRGLGRRKAVRTGFVFRASDFISQTTGLPLYLASSPRDTPDAQRKTSSFG
jgi:hypothetical protein